MKRWFIGFFAISLLALLGFLIYQDTGHMSLSYGDLRMDTTLWMGLLALLSLWFALWVVVKTAVGLWRFPQVCLGWWSRRQGSRTQASFINGIVAFLEYDFAASERFFC